MDLAITGNMVHLMAVMKVVKRFQTRVREKRGDFIDGILGRESRFTSPPNSMRARTKSQDTDNRQALDKLLVTSGINRNVEVNDNGQAVPPDMENLKMYASPEAEDESDLERRLGETEAHYKQRLETLKHHPDSLGITRRSTAGSSIDPQPAPLESRSRTFPVDGHLKGHAHDPLEDTLYLNIGHDPDTNQDDLNYYMVSESPPAVEENIYEQAYAEEMERILARRGREPSVYMTRRVEHRDDIRTSQYIKDAGRAAARQAAAHFERAKVHGRPVVESGKSYAKSAGGKASESWASGSAAAAPYLQSGKEYLEPWKQSGKEYLEPWKQSAKTAASRAGEKLGGWYSKSGGGGSGGEGFSGLVAKAQAKTKAGRAGQEGETTEESGGAERAEPQSAPAALATESSQGLAPEEGKASTDEKPDGLPIGTSVFKEHI